MNTNSNYPRKKRVLEEVEVCNLTKFARGELDTPTKRRGVEGYSFPTPNDSINNAQSLAYQEEEEVKVIEATIDILSSFSKRGYQQASASSTLAPLNLHLPFPNPKWRIPFDSPDSLPSFLIPSPRSSTRSDASDLSYISNIPSKALLALLSKESDLLISSVYIRSVAQNALENRLLMINWIYDIAAKLSYLPETSYIAISFYDRYLEKNRVRIFKQQKLAALACIFIAAKLHEELREPIISEMLAFTGDLFKANDLKKMERKLVSFFEFNLSCVSPLTILDEAFHSIGYPEARNCSLCSPFNTTRSRIEQHLNPLLKKIQRNFELSSVRPSNILRICMEFLGLERSVGKHVAELFQIAMLLPPVDEDLRTKILAALGE